MQLNATCVPVNGSACAAPNSPVGLAVGLTLFFLLLVAIAVVTVGKFCKHKWNTPPSDRKKSQKKERTGTSPSEHPYAGMSRKQPAENNPIYENLAEQRSADRPHSRPPRVPAEDLYLRCDSPDDAIYSNDPACHLTILPRSPDDDIYIVPES